MQTNIYKLLKPRVENLSYVNYLFVEKLDKFAAIQVLYNTAKSIFNDTKCSWNLTHCGFKVFQNEKLSEEKEASCQMRSERMKYAEYVDEY